MKLIRSAQGFICVQSVPESVFQYLSASKGASGLSKALLTFTREQRHLGIRVIISTQGALRVFDLAFYNPDGNLVQNPQ